MFLILSSCLLTANFSAALCVSARALIHSHAHAFERSFHPYSLFSLLFYFIFIRHDSLHCYVGWLCLGLCCSVHNMHCFCYCCRPLCVSFAAMLLLILWKFIHFVNSLVCMRLRCILCEHNNSVMCMH